MLGKKCLIFIILAISIGLAAYDFFLFLIPSKIVFQIHNISAFLIGVGFIYFSYTLIIKKAENRYVHLLSMTVGFAMVVIHLTKLAIGKCVWIRKNYLKSKFLIINYAEMEELIYFFLTKSNLIFNSLICCSGTSEGLLSIGHSASLFLGNAITSLMSL